MFGAIVCSRFRFGERRIRPSVTNRRSRGSERGMDTERAPRSSSRSPEKSLGEENLFGLVVIPAVFALSRNGAPGGQGVLAWTAGGSSFEASSESTLQTEG